MLSNTENCFLESASQGAADLSVKGRVVADQRGWSVMYKDFESSGASDQMSPVKIFSVEALDALIWYHSFFQEIPMNFVDPKEIDIPRHGTKNRYKTILPSKFLGLASLCCKAQAFPHFPLPPHFPSSRLPHSHQTWSCKQIPRLIILKMV